MAALRLMQRYHWPGNIRELQNCIERAIIVAKQPVIEVQDLPPYLVQTAADAAQPAGEAGPGMPAGGPADSLDDELARFERQRIVDALRQTGGVQVKAAALLGITERSMWHRIKKLQIRTTRMSE